MGGERRTERARRLRRDSTEAEMKLWLALKDRRLRGLKFRRQHPFGRFTLDFYCAEAALVVEVDGGQHAEITAARDAGRTALLERRGLLVLRFWNNEVLETLEGVLARIVSIAEPRVNPVPPP